MHKDITVKIFDFYKRYKINNAYYKSIDRFCYDWCISIIYVFTFHYELLIVSTFFVLTKNTL